MIKCKKPAMGLACILLCPKATLSMFARLPDALSERSTSRLARCYVEYDQHFLRTKNGTAE